MDEHPGHTNEKRFGHDIFLMRWVLIIDEMLVIAKVGGITHRVA